MKCNKRQLADIFGVAENTLTSWKKAGMPIMERATKKGAAQYYETSDCIQWYLEHKSQGEYNLTAEKARLTYHQANKTAIEEATLRGQMLDAEEVLQAWVDRTLKMRAVLLALPTKLASVVMAAQTMPEVRDYAQKEIYAALDELANTFYPGDHESH